MSADNWAICPRCRDTAEAERQERLRVAADAYGKVSAAEYEALRSAALISEDPESFQTFRENYEFYGAGEGTIIASYKGHCQRCHLAVQFKHEVPFYSPRPRAGRFVLFQAMDGYEAYITSWDTWEAAAAAFPIEDADTVLLDQETERKWRTGSPYEWEAAAT